MKYIDLHCDTILRIMELNSQLIKNDLHIDISKMSEGNSLAQCFAMFVDLNSTKSPYNACNKMIDRFYYELEVNQNELVFASNVNDILDNEKNNKMSAILTVEEGGVLEGKIENLINLYNRGVRMMTLTWNFANEIGFPNFKWIKGEIPDFTKPNIKDGLTDFGIEVVNKMNQLGMIIDVSHLSDAGFYDVARYSTQPFVASHSNSRVVCNHVRNLTDDMLKVLADNGGITGLNYCTAFINENAKTTTIEDMVSHIKHIVNIAGIDVMSLGSDFDGIKPTLEIQDASKMSMLFDALKKHGFTDDQLEKIFYQNALRVFKTVLK